MIWGFNMGDIIKIIYNKSDISRYKISVLADNECSLFLPVTFTHIDDKLLGMYSTSGYSQIAESELIDAEDAVELFTDAVHKMREAMERFIFPEDYQISSKTVFADSKNKSIKCMFVPRKNMGEDILNFDSGKAMATFEAAHINEAKSLYPNLKKISDIICRHTSENGCKYIRKSIECIEKNRYGIDCGLKKIESMKEEIYRLGIDRKLSIRL